MLRRNKRGRLQVNGLHVKFIHIDFYKLFLNLIVLAFLGFIVWSAIKLFSGSFLQSPLIGSLVFFGEIIAFIFLCRQVRANRWRPPSIVITTLVLAAMAIVMAFAGVQPLSNYKDQVIGKVSNFISTQKAEAARQSAEAKATEVDRLNNLGVNDPSSVVEEISKNRGLEIGLEVLEKVNDIRKERSSSELQWDDKLYEYSVTHAQKMAAQKRLFHTSMYESYAENAWGGEGSKNWGAQDIVNSWMGSKMHRTWLLCPHLEHVAVGVAYSTNGMYAAWTFWRSETTQSDYWYVHGDEPPNWWH